MKKLLQKFKKNKELMPNYKVLVKRLVYQSSDAREFQNKMNEAIAKNYTITNHLVDERGVFKFTAKLKPAKLTKCTLQEKKLPEKDKVRPSSKTYPWKCNYFINGVCTLANHDVCLYQKTKEHEAVLKQMVNIYEKESQICIEKYKYYDYNNISDHYEDTEYGRIFSGMYEHLNKLPKAYNRLNGD